MFQSAQHEMRKIWQRARGKVVPTVIDRQADLVYFGLTTTHAHPSGALEVHATENSEIWQHFRDRQLRDTYRVTLEHFHLFEWFPLLPGKYHQPRPQWIEESIRDTLRRAPDGSTYFDPDGKASLIDLGYGAVRMLPRRIGTEDHYFMTASSNGVCHQGFPVLVPRHLYGQLIHRIQAEGTIPVTLRGEMRYLPAAPTFFGGDRTMPLLYLYVDGFTEHREPRPTIARYSVTIAVAFLGEFNGVDGHYVTFYNYNPGRPTGLHDASTWLRDFYVEGLYAGRIISDFDEADAVFPDAVFGLPRVMQGQLNRVDVHKVLRSLHAHESQGNQYYMYVEHMTQTQGGAFVGRDINTGGGDFIGRDQLGEK